jgi:hypothetical protein
MCPLPRLAYRSRQFWRALLGPKTPVADSLLHQHLSPAQISLFRRMQTSEQAHASEVLARLTSAGQADPDLLAAALLHDAGKVRSPLTLPDRVLIVLGKRLFPQTMKRWGTGEPKGLRRPFVAAAQHPAWGAELASAAGAASRTCELIRRHQDVPSADDSLLAALQEADNEN